MHVSSIIMHNMIIESEWEHPVYDPEPYHPQGPLATLDQQVPIAFAVFLVMRQEIQDANTHSQLQDDLVEHFVDAQRKQRLVLFVIHLFEFYFDFKLLFLCMNNNLNNLYGSGGCISCRLTAELFLEALAQRWECLFQKFRPNL
jgi:hypothetical protein